MKHFPALILALLFCQLSLCQVKTRAINGTVKDIQNESIAGATLKLLNASDSALIKGETTGNNGKFQFDNLQNGNYLISISSVGYKKYVSAPLTIDETHASIVLPVVILLPARNTDLKGVVVTSKRPLIEQDLDKTIVNVDAMISSATSNTLEVLEKTPGVTVDNNGNISLNGKSGVLILIDGRSTYMSAQDLASYLKSLPGGLLDKLELMDNPPAKYDAAGGAVINIRLKKNKARGLTGNLAASYNQGVVARSYESLNVNYNGKKANWFGNFGYSVDGQYMRDTYDRKFYTSNSELSSQVILGNKSTSHSHGLSSRLGLDYTLSPKTIIGFQVNQQKRPGSNRNTFTSKSYDSGSTLDSTNSGYSVNKNDWTNTGVNFNFQHKLNNQGRELSGDLNYINYNSDGIQNFDNYMNLPNAGTKNTSTFKYDQLSVINIYNLKVDYVHPMKNKLSFEAGIKSSIVDNDNNSGYFDIDGSGDKPDYSKSNHFIYHENINSAYFLVRKNWKRIGTQLGIRAENTQLRGKQLGNSMVPQTRFTQNFTDFFPTVFISYKLDSTGQNTITGSIGRRINRPNYQQFNPFQVFRDNYSYSMGNPDLGPQYQYRYEIKYQHKQLLGFGLSYGYATDIIAPTTEIVNTVFITRPNNISKGTLLILSTNLSLNPSKWWLLNANIQLGHLEISGQTYTERLSQSLNSARINISNQFTFKKGWSAELTGFYAARDINGQVLIKGRYRTYAGVQKKIMKDKGSIKISIDDLANSWEQKDQSINLKQAFSIHKAKADTQRIGFAFSYRFGNETFARKRRHNDNAADGEKGRVE